MNNICVKIPIRLRMHAGVRWVYAGMSVSDGECQLPMGHVGIRSGMLVSNVAFGLQ